MNAKCKHTQFHIRNWKMFIIFFVISFFYTYFVCHRQCYASMHPVPFILLFIPTFLLDIFALSFQMRQNNKWECEPKRKWSFTFMSKRKNEECSEVKIESANGMQHKIYWNVDERRLFLENVFGMFESTYLLMNGIVGKRVLMTIDHRVNNDHENNFSFSNRWFFNELHSQLANVTLLLCMLDSIQHDVTF